MPLFKKLLDVFIYLLFPAWGQIVTIKTSHDVFSFGKDLFTTKQFISSKTDFSGKEHIPKWAPFAPRDIASHIAGKSCNNRGLYRTFNLMAWKHWISLPVAHLLTFNFNLSMDNNYIHYKVWDEIINPFLNFNGCTVEV